MIISNAGPLIYLAKLGKLNLLQRLFKDVIISKEVYEEVVKGKEEKFFDALIIKKSIEEGWIKVKESKADKKISQFAPEIDQGEISTINLAKKFKPSLVLIDDASGRAIAESFGLNVKGTLYVLLRAYRKKLINKKEAKDSVNKLVFSGFRISQEVYIKVLEELDKSYKLP